jgi:ubiquinone/menaquinone biosynthesis C-methylase UbiE
MTRLRITLALFALIAAFTPAAGRCSSSVSQEAEAIYSQKTPSRDGIGKVYMGREISFVMGHRGVGWLERPEREREERTDLVIEAMELASDAVVVDLGAGSGYFTFRLSLRVPQGRVLAVDIQPEMIEVLERRKRNGSHFNVDSVLGTVRSPNLPAGSVDAVLMVDAYHEFSHPHEMMTAIFDALRPGGFVYLVEYRAEDPAIQILPLHKMTEAQARREMEAIGLEFVENRTMLPQQHFLVFRKSPEIATNASHD